MISELILFIKTRFGVGVVDTNSFSKKEENYWHDQNKLSSDTTSKRAHVNFVNKLSFIIFQQSLSASGLQKIYNQAYIRFCLIHILSGMGAIRLCGYFTERLILICRRYALVEMGYSLSRILIHRYSIHEHNLSKLKKFRALRDLFWQEMHKEDLVESAYCQIIDHYKLKKNHKDFDEVRRAYTSIEGIESEVNNPRMYLLKYLVEFYQYDLPGDVKHSIDVAERALDYFSSLPYDYHAAKRIFLNKVVSSRLRLREYDHVEELLERSSILDTQKALSWARNKEILFIVYMRRMKWGKAKKVLAQLDQKTTRILGSQLRDRILLYKLYLDIAATKNPNLRIYRSMNDLPRFQQDLSGMNISLIIADLLYRAMNRDFDAIRNKKESIENYIDRHVKDNVRSKWIIRLLLNLPSAEVHWHRFRSQSNRMIGRMKNSVDAVEEIEIIDYEILWKMVCSHALKNNKRYQHSQREMEAIATKA